LREAYKETVKQTRQEKISAAKQAVIEQLSEDEQALAGDPLKSLEKAKIVVIAPLKRKKVTVGFYPIAS